MELRHLRYFVAVAEERSFSAAAKRLRIAQPPLSMQIRGIEERLGVELFDRSQRPVALTPAGLAFLEDARRILGDMQETQLRVSRFGQGEAGLLRIAFISPLADDLLADIIRRFRARFPGVELDLSEMASSRQAAALAQKQIDIGFMRRSTASEAFRCRPVRECQLKLAVPLRHPFRSRRRVGWPDLRGEPLVMLDPRTAIGFYDEFLQKCGRTLQDGAYQLAGDIHTAFWMVAAGFGVSPTIDSYGNRRQRNIAFIDLPPDAPRMDIVMAAAPESMNPTTVRFLEFAEKIIAGQAP